MAKILNFSIPKEGRERAWWIWVGVLGFFLAVGIFGAIRVFVNGLHVTGLSDQVPWGLWITQDLSSIATGAGAFTLSAIVYLFRIKKYQPIARVAVFVGFLGYSSAMIALALDIGRPDRFWHPLVYWNVHSVLWEITWCVVLYTIVLVLEFLPIFFEGKFFDRWPQVRKYGATIHKASPIFAGIGLALSLLHQSSLGATYGVLSGRAIWYKPSLPVMFILSAIAGGIAMTLLLTILVGKLNHRQIISRALQYDISRIAGFALLAYLYLKVWDWAATSYYSQSPGTTEALTLLQSTTPYTQTFLWIEIILGGIVPAIILLNPILRKNDRYTMLALGSIVVGVTVNRWNVTLSGLIAPPHWSPGVLGGILSASYLPTWNEIIVSLGIIAYALLAFSFGVKYLPIFPKDGEVFH
ncbi:MAG: polysulfide reductase NrfD [Anaerolineales bacterium]|nr:polysulfide reductase NrfD [Anaerolineales bacterium]